MNNEDTERFIDDCRFAKIVDTVDGPAIRIGSDIINIRSSNPQMHIDGITKALRQIDRGVGGKTSPLSGSSSRQKRIEDHLPTPPAH